VAQATIGKGDLPLEYKYEVVDENFKVVCSEKGNRKLNNAAGAKGAVFLMKDEAFNYPNPIFKGAGVAIPG
jgi:hypothetical protein